MGRSWAVLSEPAAVLGLVGAGRPWCRPRDPAPTRVPRLARQRVTSSLDLRDLFGHRHMPQSTSMRAVPRNEVRSPVAPAPSAKSRRRGVRLIMSPKTSGNVRTSALVASRSRILTTPRGAGAGRTWWSDCSQASQPAGSSAPSSPVGRFHTDRPATPHRQQFRTRGPPARPWDAIATQAPERARRCSTPEEVRSHRRPPGVARARAVSLVAVGALAGGVAIASTTAPWSREASHLQPEARPGGPPRPPGTGPGVLPVPPDAPPATEQPVESAAAPALAADPRTGCADGTPGVGGSPGLDGVACRRPGCLPGNVVEHRRGHAAPGERATRCPSS